MSSESRLLNQIFFFHVHGIRITENMLQKPLVVVELKTVRSYSKISFLLRNKKNCTQSTSRNTFVCDFFRLLSLSLLLLVVTTFRLLYPLASLRCHLFIWA